MDQADHRFALTVVAPDRREGEGGVGGALHLHIHLGGPPPLTPLAEDQPRRRPLLLTFGAAAVIAATLGLGYHFGRVEPNPSRQAVSAVQPPASGLPPSLARDLAQPPHLTPPPASGMSGPAAFGLGN